jgi:hypothetical protein
MVSMDAMGRGFAGVLLVTLGCSGSTTTSGTGSPSAGPPIAEADFAATYVQTMCEVLGKCCGAAGVAFDVQACPKTLKAPTSQQPYEMVYDLRAYPSRRLAAIL